MAKRKDSGVTYEGESRSKRSRTEQQLPTPSKASNESPPKASLLGLPAELRNRIYGYAFGSCELYTLRAPSGLEPALLRCSSQIRCEARAMWLQTVHSRVIVQNGKFEPRVGHWFWRDYEASRTEFHCEGEPYLKNICEWVRQLYAGVAPEWSTVRVNDEWKEKNKDYLTFFAFVRLMDHLPWETVERAMRHMTKKEDLS